MSSKLSKTALKSLIKECLIEILAEGLVGQAKTPAQMDLLNGLLGSS